MVWVDFFGKHVRCIDELTDSLVLNKNLEVLKGFEELMAWYAHWWTEKNMEESGQHDRIENQGPKPTSIGMSIVARKWEVLKDGYSSYTEKVRKLCCKVIESNVRTVRCMRSRTATLQFCHGKKLEAPLTPKRGSNRHKTAQKVVDAFLGYLA